MDMDSPWELKVGDIVRVIKGKYPDLDWMCGKDYVVGATGWVCGERVAWLNGCVRPGCVALDGLELVQARKPGA